MKVIVAGSRNIINAQLTVDAIKNSGFDITEIVSGHAIGVDRAGELYAQANAIKVKLFVPDWDKYGKSAGYRRNVEMADYADALVAVWDGKSRGTKHMIDIAKAKGLKVYIHPSSNG